MSSSQTNDIICILDESGSMRTMGSEPIQAMNAFIRIQQENKCESFFSLYTFNMVVRKIYDNVPLSQVKIFEDYKPEGTTALYDCISQAIDSNKNKNVIFLIITDGEDNASKCRLLEIKEKIKTRETEYNWQFIYMAANQDAFAVGGEMNIQENHTFSYNQSNPGELLKLVRQCSEPILNYRTKMTKNLNLSKSFSD